MTKKPASTAAERMRRSRDLRKKGQRIIPATIKDTEVDGMVNCLLLDPNNRGDPAAIGDALGRLLDAIPPATWPTFLGSVRRT